MDGNKSGGYGVFSRFYDVLQRDVQYEKRAGCYLALLERLGGKPQMVLDLACGTGSFSLALAHRGLEVIGVDASTEMLMAAQDKAREAELPLLFLCQRMEKLDLYGTVDTVFCTLDSLNHLPDEKAVLTVFQKVALFLEPGGYFLFDVNTPYKHDTVLAGHTFVKEAPDVYCVWQNRPCGQHIVEITLDFFNKRPDRSYERFTERFFERAYSDPILRKLLAQAELSLAGVYDEWGKEPENSKEYERLVYVAKSKK